MACIPEKKASPYSVNDSRGYERNCRTLLVSKVVSMRPRKRLWSSSWFPTCRDRHVVTIRSLARSNALGAPVHTTDCLTFCSEAVSSACMRS